MVKKNKGLLFFLLAFSVCLNSPAYSANKTIKYLPANQDADTVNGDYSQNPIELTDTVTNNSSCVCSEKFAEADRCDNCVSLQGECPDCCLSSGKTAKKCAKEENNDYDCKTKPFSTDSCDKVICDYTEDDDKDTSSTCGANCKPYEDDDEVDGDYPGCDRAKCEDGAVKSGSPYGLERRGCPEPDSQELAPNGSCTLLSGSGLDRKWKCTDSGDLLPKFGGCNPNTDFGLPKKKLEKSEDYYEVTLATPSCVYGGCSTGSCGGCSTGYPTCSSGPSCNPGCSVSCPKQCTPTCFNGACSSPQPCIDYTNACTYECSASMCSPGCGVGCSTCSGPGPCTVSCWCESHPCSSYCLPGNNCIPEKPFFIYVFTPAFKDYINACVPYADEYEKCRDRIKCCQDNVCSGESGDDIDYDSKCEDSSCQDRIADTSGVCNAYNDEQTCTNLRAKAEACLRKPQEHNCYKEISDTFYFDFVAKSNETYNITWQIASAVSYANNKKIKKETAKLYTMIKIFDNTEEVVYPGGQPLLDSYMLQVKGLNAAFSIYGSTQVTGLTAGKAYRIRLYYYRTSNRKDSKGNPVPNTTIKVKKMSLIVLRTRQ